MNMKRRRGGAAFTLVEMLIAMAITLVMMGAVVTLFANITNSVTRRRATIEMSSQLRHMRNVMQQDLQGATCPGVTWQRPESNHGYIEVIEGLYREGNATNLIDRDPNNKNTLPSVINPEIDHNASIIPSSNLPFKDPSWATDAAGLGDADDILMLTSRNEHEPFVGRIPSIGNKASFRDWDNETIQSTLAEVIWFAIENPGFTDEALTDPDPSGKHFFGEPGMRTIYRRALLIAPWVNPYKSVDVNNDGLVKDADTNVVFKAVPGLVRMLGGIPVEKAIAATIAFQDRYDLSVRLEWDPSLKAYKIMANTLSDLTKRENRFGHFFYRPQPSGVKPIGREYPFAMISTGSGYSSNSANVRFVEDPDTKMAAVTRAKATANIDPVTKSVVSFSIDPANVGDRYQAPPFVFVDDKSATIATARAMLNDDGQVVRVVFGPTPLWGARRGQDVMMTDALAFDLRVYDPGAPLFATRKFPNTTDFSADVVLTPTDPGWLDAYMSSDNMGSTLGIGNNNSNKQVVYMYVGQGAYVDMGYGYNPDSRLKSPFLPSPLFAASFSSSAMPWFFDGKILKTYGGLIDVYGSQLAPGYSVYDTWSFHYENNGVNEDGYWYDGTRWHWYDPATGWKTKAPPQQDWRKIVDQGTDGLDNDGALGVDDAGERETTPAYDKPLRGVQVLLRSYERDSRAIRQVRVTQHFMPE